jgi:hypothetical protein
MRGHCKLHPPSSSKHKKLSEAAQRILARECAVQADFTTPEVGLRKNRAHPYRDFTSVRE